jgi:hypothetical protein
VQYRQEMFYETLQVFCKFQSICLIYTWGEQPDKSKNKVGIIRTQNIASFGGYFDRVRLNEQRITSRASASLRSDQATRFYTD